MIACFCSSLSSTLVFFAGCISEFLARSDGVGFSYRFFKFATFEVCMFPQCMKLLGENILSLGICHRKDACERMEWRIQQSFSQRYPEQRKKRQGNRVREDGRNNEECGSPSSRYGTFPTVCPPYPTPIPGQYHNVLSSYWPG